MTTVAGVDGCRAGWIALLLPETGEPVILVTPRFQEILDHPFAPEIIAVDMPIGLPETVGPGGRGPEQATRALLQRRTTSVFSVPSRSAVSQADYREACAEAARTSRPSKMVSKQAFGLFPKIRDLDALMTPDLEHHVYETHPELAFWRLNNGREMEHGKKSPEGKEERRGVLQRQGLPRTALERAPTGAAVDDLLDAAACALIARRIARGEATSFPAAPDRDAKGLRMAIWA